MTVFGGNGWCLARNMNMVKRKTSAHLSGSNDGNGASDRLFSRSLSMMLQAIGGSGRPQHATANWMHSRRGYTNSRTAKTSHPTAIAVNCHHSQLPSHWLSNGLSLTRIPKL